MANIFVGAAIILVPLGLFLLVMARDLSYEEDGLTRRVARLQRTYSSMISEIRADSINSDSDYFNDNGADLDEDDAKLIRSITSKLKADNKTADNKTADNKIAVNKIADNLALAFNKAIRIRNNERIILNKKIKNFKTYSTMMILLICISLGLLLYLSDLNL